MVAVERGGRVEHVRVGTAVRQGEGFVLRLGELLVGAVADRRPAPASPSAGHAGAAPAAAGGVVFPNYGRRKGEPIHGAAVSDLEYYAAGCRRTLADPGKARWHDKERVLLAAIEAELARQQGVPPMASPAGDEGALPPAYDGPPLTDDDIPF
jgi:hypothetical protein